MAVKPALPRTAIGAYWCWKNLLGFCGWEMFKPFPKDLCLVCWMLNIRHIK